MGVVYRVFDREKQTQVALKYMKRMSAQALVRFKNEFRALQGVHHRNLVRLGELFQQEDQWFFTMELVQGQDFLSYLRSGESGGRKTATLGATKMSAATNNPTVVTHVESGSSVSGPQTTLTPAVGTNLDTQAPRIGTDFDEERLRPALAQLAYGLQALHRMGNVHRDIKPSNVLVTDDERVVILDFGLITDYVEDRWQDRQLVGTIGYMAPEQAGGTHLGPEADWYSVGALLYLVLTGFRPLGKGGLPPPPSAYDPRVPQDLDQLCLRLLAPDPKNRSGAIDILQIADPTKEWEAEIVEEHDANEQTIFVGRDSEQEFLEHAYLASMKHSVSVFVTGESGVGKSALVTEFLRKRRVQDNNVILHARCYERESASYKGVDGIVDELSQFLARIHPREVGAFLPKQLPSLARLFPALQRVEEIALAAKDPSTTSEQEQRQRGIAALRQFFINLSKHYRIIISIDDLQWADADSWRILEEIMRPPEAPGVLFVGTRRGLLETETGDSNAVISQWKGDVRFLHVEGLTNRSARELAIGLVGEHPHLDAIIAEAAGHPLFLIELCHLAIGQQTDHSFLPLNDAVHRRVSELDLDSRRLLHIVALAGAPIRQSTARLAAEVAVDSIDRILHPLRIGRLIQTTGTGSSDFIEPYHDRVRSSIVAGLDREQRINCHGALAAVLEAEPVSDAQQVAIHWQGAQNHNKASHYFRKAADRASQTLAFARAARLYQQAIDLADTNSHRKIMPLYIALAECLSNAGRGPEAAQAFEYAANTGPLDLAARLRQRAADQLLRSGHIDEGIAAMAPALKSY